MSDGGIQKGYSFWATINIKRASLPKEKLQEAMDKIRTILKDVDGDVVNCVQLTPDQDPGTAITTRHSPKYRKKMAEKKSK
jgi:hypothetical protein